MKEHSAAMRLSAVKRLPTADLGGLYRDDFGFEGALNPTSLNTPMKSASRWILPGRLLRVSFADGLQGKGYIGIEDT